MKAIRQKAFGGPEELLLEEIPDPQPGQREVRIRVESAGVHLLDTVIRKGQGNPRVMPTLPVTPGREVAGVVDATGPGVGSGVLGRRVVADLGVASGGYAELALAEAASLHEIPDSLDADRAVTMIGTGRTTMAILELAALRPGDVVVVTAAAGGIGTLLVQAADAAGAMVIGAAGGQKKTSLVRDLGATSAVDYLERSSELEWLRAGMGVLRASLLSSTLPCLASRIGDPDARVPEYHSRCVTITGRGHRARSADLHGGLDVSMLLLRYAGMADLYTGVVQRRVRTIPGSAAGHSASRPAAAPGTVLSLDLPSPGLPADHATCGTPSCPGG